MEQTICHFDRQKYYIIVILFYTSLATVLCLLPIFKKWIAFLLLSFESLLCILNTNPL